MDATVDRAMAAAESRLDRIDDAPDEPETQYSGDVSPDEDGMHVEGSDASVDEREEEDAPSGPDAEVVDVINAFADAFNARDMDGVLDLLTADAETPGLGGDRDNAPAALHDLWDQRPTSVVTRGEHEDGCVAVLWDLGGEGWWRVGMIWFDDVSDGQAGVVEFVDDPTVLEAVIADEPDGDVEEGMSWHEWDEGVDGD